ncbi:MAG: hypothetical protein U0905_11320 [Pirellulales bacterium]
MEPLSSGLNLSASADAPHAAELLPASTQGLLRIHSLPKLTDRWNETQLGGLANVPGMAEFWEEQKQEIHSRLADAGWQLNMQPNDFVDIGTGQVAVKNGSIAPAMPRNAFSIAVVIDIQGSEKKTGFPLGSHRVRAESQTRVD